MQIQHRLEDGAEVSLFYYKLDRKNKHIGRVSSSRLIFFAHTFFIVSFQYSDKWVGAFKHGAARSSVYHILLASMTNLEEHCINNHTTPQVIFEE